MALWAAIIWVPGWSRPVLVALLVALGIAAGAFILNFAYAKESVPARLAGTVSGIANMGVMMGGLVMQPLVGWVLDRHWSGALTPGGARLYDLDAYRTAFSMIFVWPRLAPVPALREGNPLQAGGLRPRHPNERQDRPMKSLPPSPFATLVAGCLEEGRPMPTCSRVAQDPALELQAIRREAARHHPAQLDTFCGTAEKVIGIMGVDGLRGRHARRARRRT
jgi:MFS family permease